MHDKCAWALPHPRHCERSEAIHLSCRLRERWIASQELAMTWMDHSHCGLAKAVTFLKKSNQKTFGHLDRAHENSIGAD